MCPEGHYCGSEGLAEPSGTCAAGFLCVMGASVPNPTDNRTGSLCPAGSFCQQGLRTGGIRSCIGQCFGFSVTFSFESTS